MAVYTEVSEQEARELLLRLGLGELCALKGCQGGIENTNYFADTTLDGQPHHYVLTLFERLTAEQLPFYLRLMKHLAQHGIAVPEPMADATGELLFQLKDKPTAVVNKLSGKSELAPTPEHCSLVGNMLARMHLAGCSFDMHQPNLRGLAWWNETVPVVLPYLPRGAIHADLFRDNVLFDCVDGQPVLSGFFDFYFAGVDTWLFDLAVCLNDWCIDLATGVQNGARARALIASYESVRPLVAAERELLPAMLRAGALRFWISRLWDFHLPREASMLQAHDPVHFERVLRQRVDAAQQFKDMAVAA